MNEVDAPAAAIAISAANQPMSQDYVSHDQPVPDLAVDPPQMAPHEQNQIAISSHGGLMFVNHDAERLKPIKDKRIRQHVQLLSTIRKRKDQKRPRQPQRTALKILTTVEEKMNDHYDTVNKFLGLGLAALDTVIPPHVHQAKSLRHYYYCRKAAKDFSKYLEDDTLRRTKKMFIREKLNTKGHTNHDLSLGERYNRTEKALKGSSVILAICMEFPYQTIPAPVFNEFLLLLAQSKSSLLLALSAKAAVNFANGLETYEALLASSSASSPSVQSQNKNSTIQHEDRRKHSTEADLDHLNQPADSSILQQTEVNGFANISPDKQSGQHQMELDGFMNDEQLAAAEYMKWYWKQHPPPEPPEQHILHLKRELRYVATGGLLTA
jgi:hypothetical protein